MARATLHKALQRKACDLVMPDLMRIGGVTGWLRAAAIAGAAGMPMSTHLYPEVAAHVMRVTETAHWLEWQDWADPILQQPYEIKDGHAAHPRRARRRPRMGRGFRRGQRRRHVAKARSPAREAAQPEEAGRPLAQASCDACQCSPISLATGSGLQSLSPTRPLGRCATIDIEGWDSRPRSMVFGRKPGTRAMSMEPLPAQRRRLAAILAADVVGYSRQMGLDEAGTLARLKACRKQIAEPITARHGGRVVSLAGDGAIIEFPSVVEAVQAAVEIQAAMAERNAGVPEVERVEFRVGINLGDIIEEDDDVYGDGVNVAARLEALAEPGGIVVAGSVHHQVKDKLDLCFQPMGGKGQEHRRAGRDAGGSPPPARGVSPAARAGARGDWSSQWPSLCSRSCWQVLPRHAGGRARHRRRPGWARPRSRCCRSTI